MKHNQEDYSDDSGVWQGQEERLNNSSHCLYCVIYRTGGLDNFKWNRSAAMTRVEAQQRAGQMTQHEGYVAFYERYELSKAIGLPETYGVTI